MTSSTIYSEPRLAGPPDRASGNLDATNRATFEGQLKVRLGHSNVGSVLVPEQLFVRLGKWRFFQTCFFGAPYFRFNIGDGLHDVSFNMDVCGPRSHRASRLHVYFRSADMLRQFDDGAQIYNCTFEGPRQIMRFGAGRARARSDGDFDLELFHITNPTAASNIRASHEIRISSWNLQGIRRLENVAYIYLTTLPSVGTEDDLRRIAMASGGKIGFQTTSSRLIEEELQMTVYREDTTGRTTPLPVTVPSAYLAPSHLLLHRPGTFPAYYEVVGPEIVRVGVNPGSTLRYDGCTGFVNAEDLKRFDYLVLGDAAEVEGLAAPFDEEETGQIMHLERLALGEDIFSFWWDHRNSDLVTGRAFESRQLAPDPPS